MLLREGQFETHQAFELALGLPAAADVDLGLALLAEIVRLHLGDRGPVDRLAAALLDEGPKHRRLAVFGRKIDAIPAVEAVARGEEVAQQVGFIAIPRRVARIAHDADASKRAALVKPRREYDR